MDNLRAAFTFGVDVGFVAKNPVTKHHRRKIPKKTDDDRRILLRGEEKKLLASAEKLYGHRMAAFIRFALAS